MFLSYLFLIEASWETFFLKKRCGNIFLEELAALHVCRPVTSRYFASPPSSARASFSDREPRTRSSASSKMADGVCSTGDAVSNAIEKTAVKDYDNVCVSNDRVAVGACEKVIPFCMASVGDKLFDKLCEEGPKHEGYLEMPCSEDDDCRKKRCVDRYDSSESSDRYCNLSFYEQRRVKGDNYVFLCHVFSP